jgi:predicted Fe-Mo cluster-binding NifX family protein
MVKKNFAGIFTKKEKGMKRVAIPVTNGLLSEYFEQCDYYKIFDVEGRNIRSKKIETPPGKELTKLPEWAAGMGITDIIAYKIDKSIITSFTSFSINLFVGIPVNSPQNLIKDYINGKLVSDEEIINAIIAAE